MTGVHAELDSGTKEELGLRAAGVDQLLAGVHAEEDGTHGVEAGALSDSVMVAV